MTPEAITALATLIGAVGALIVTITALVVSVKNHTNINAVKTVATDTQTSLHEAGIIEPPK